MFGFFIKKFINNWITNWITNLVSIKDTKLLWFFLVLFYIAIRTPVWFYPIDSDHWIFAVIGQRWISGEGILYIDFWDHKPPIIFIINGLVSLITGGDIWLFRLMLTVFNLVEIYLFYKLIKSLINKLPENYLINKTSYPLIISALYAIIRNFSQIASSGNNTENFGVILIIISYSQLLIFYQPEIKNRSKSIMLIGICFSLIFWLKANMTLLFIPIFVAITYKLFTIWISGQKIKSIKLFTILFLPLVVVSLAIISYFGSLGYLSELWIGSFGFSAKYVQVGFKGALSDTKTFLLILLPLFLMLLFPLGNWVIRLKNQKLNKLELLIFFTLLINLFYLGISGTYYPYYVLISLPVLIVFGFIGHINLKGLLQKISSAIIIFGIVICGVISYKQPFNFFYGEVANLQNEYFQIADYIKKNTDEDDRIFSYIYGASLYGLTGRKPATKYLSASFMLLDYREKLGFNINQTVLRDLSSQKSPKFVIMYKDKNPKTSLYATNQPIQEFLLTNYSKIEKKFETLEIRSRGN